MIVAELTEEDLAFLGALWHTPEVMRYAGELPRLRGGSRADGAATAWARYREQRAALGSGDTQPGRSFHKSRWRTMSVRGQLGDRLPESQSFLTCAPGFRRRKSRVSTWWSLAPWLPGFCPLAETLPKGENLAEVESVPKEKTQVLTLQQPYPAQKVIVHKRHLL